MVAAKLAIIAMPVAIGPGFLNKRLRRPLRIASILMGWATMTETIAMRTLHNSCDGWKAVCRLAVLLFQLFFFVGSAWACKSEFDCVPHAKCTLGGHPWFPHAKACARKIGPSVTESGGCLCGELSMRPKHCSIDLNGPISAADARGVIDALPPPKGLGTVGRSITFNSSGGDVLAALEIGRAIRKAELWANLRHSDRCASACVFALLGAVHRTIGVHGTISGEIIVHRPYRVNDGQPMTVQELQSFETMIRAYVREMNYSDRLVDLMLAVPPEQGRLLNRNELREFVIHGEDRWWRERNDQIDAQHLGISRNELIRRRQNYWRCFHGPIDKKNESGADHVISCDTIFLKGANQGWDPRD